MSTDAVKEMALSQRNCLTRDEDMNQHPTGELYSVLQMSLPCF